MLFLGYKASVTGYDITNTYKPNVIKTYQDHKWRYYSR